MQFDDLFEGYEDRPLAGLPVAMWRYAGISTLARGDLIRLAALSVFAYGALWAACLWAAL